MQRIGHGTHHIESRIRQDPYKKNMINDEDRRDHSGNALQNEHPVFNILIAEQRHIRKIDNIKAVNRMKKNGNRDNKQFPENDKGNIAHTIDHGRPGIYTENRGTV